MIHWPVRLLVNTVYALLAERADARDLAELAQWGHVDEKSRDNLGQNRDALDTWLAGSFGKQAAADEALNRYLGGAA